MLTSFRSIVEDKQKGTYAGFKYSQKTHDKLNEFIDSNNIPDPNRDFHTTLLYSRVEAEKYEPVGTNIDVAPVMFKDFKKFGDVLVIELDSEYMTQRHNDLMNDFDELTYDYDEYIPHITLSYNAPTVNIEDLDGSFFDDFEFDVTEEYSEPLDLDWESSE